MATTRKTSAPKEDEGLQSPLENPDLLQAVEKALQEDLSLPEPDPPADTSVTLPGGLPRGDHVITSAEVRELTGEHEETLARATQAQPGNIFHFMNSVLECGVVRFGTEDPDMTKKLLKNALLGDRDALLIGIRRATYGDTIELKEWQCPECGETSDLEIPLADIPVKEMADTQKETNFTVALRKGRTAEVRLASGADQLAVFEDRKLTLAERDTLLLSRCLTAIVDADGTKHTTVGFALGYARGLNSQDRHAILEELIERQPGPQLSDMKLVHDTCGKEVELLLSIADLFPSIRMV